MYQKSCQYALFPRLYCYEFFEENDTIVYDFEYLESLNVPSFFDLDFIEFGGDSNVLILQAIVCTIHTFCGLYFLHENFGMIHSDISPSNVLFSKVDQIWKINDFNQSMPISKSIRTSRTGGTLNFRAPELNSTKKFTRESDVYSLGQTLSYLWFRQISLELAFGCDDDRSKNLCQKYTPILARIVSDKPSERPSAGEVVILFFEIFQEAHLIFPEFNFKASQYLYPLIHYIKCQQGSKKQRKKGFKLFKKLKEKLPNVLDQSF